MKRDSMKIGGLETLISKYRKAFQLPENLNHYSPTDLNSAERKFIKYMLQTGEAPDAASQNPVPQ